MRDLVTINSSNLAAPMPSLPPRVVELAGVVGRVDHPGQVPRYHLPKGWSKPGPEVRQEALQAVSTFEAVLDPSSTFDGLAAADARLGIVAKLISGTATGTMTEQAAESKIDLFEMALSDMPAWAVAKAVIRWVRREVPTSVEKAPNYAFTPPPQTIRALAQLELGYLQLALKQARKIAEIETFEQAMDPTPRGALKPKPGLRRMTSASSQNRGGL